MNLIKFKKVLEIISKYVCDEEFYFAAEHDQIFLPGEVSEFTQEDKDALEELGVFEKYDSWCFYT